MAQESAAGSLVLSPHLDDAVFSAWHVLSSAPRPRVVSVFAGVPEPGFVTDLDRAHGAEDSAGWLRRRRREDTEALDLVGGEAVHLDLLEVQFPAYRLPRVRQAIAQDPRRFLAVVAGEPALRTDPGSIVELVREHLSPARPLFGPAGIGGHPDHRDLAEAMVLLAGQGHTVHLYADSPYFLMHGPSPSTGRDGNLVVDRWIDEVSERARGWQLAREVIRLSDEQLARKQRAMGRYTTELPSVVRDLAAQGLGLDSMRFEVYWKLVREDLDGGQPR
jgi:hypothetical protein